MSGNNIMGAFIQARMNSRRFPGKVLYKLNGKPILQYLVESLERCALINQVIVITSTDESDNAIISFCEGHGVDSYRGPLENVAKRMLDTANHFNLKSFVRINGDSPLINCQIIKRAIRVFENGEYDLVTNTFPRSFPVGQSVEVIRTSTFDIAYGRMSSPDDFEYVTKYYYDHPQEFQINNFSNGKNLSGYRLVVDTQEDLDRMKTIIYNMTRPHTDYGLNELIELYPSN